MAQHPKCADLVQGHWESRRDALRALWIVHCAGDDPWNELKEYKEKYPRRRSEKTLRRDLSDDAFALIPYYDEAESNGGPEGIYDYGLCFDYVEWDEDNEYGDFFRWQLSWGGPSDELQFHTTSDLKLKWTEYRYMDWFDGAAITLDGDDEKLAQELYNWFDECETPRHVRAKVLGDE